MQSHAEIELEATDPVLANADLPLKARFYPLGFPVEIATSSRLILNAAGQAWGAFSRSFDRPPVKLTLGVNEDGATLPDPPSYRSRDHLMSIISDPENFVICDFDSGSGFGWVSKATASDPLYLRYHFLEAAVLMLVTQLYLAPLHGALVELDGCGILLCGNSHAGKSSLAYACARAGWTFICDDGTFLLRDNPRRFGIGSPHTIRLRESARKLFPELNEWAAELRANHKLGIELFTSQLPNIAIGPGSLIEHVVFLDRQGPSNPHLEPYDPEAALSWFEPYACYGKESVREAQRKTYRRLLDANLWVLSYRDLDPAIARLTRLIRNAC